MEYPIRLVVLETNRAAADGTDHGTFVQAAARKIQELQPSLLVIAGGHVLRQGMLARVVASLLAILGIDLHFETPESEGLSEATRVWKQLEAELGSYRPPRVEFIEWPRTSEENAVGVYLLMKRLEIHGYETVILCAKWWRFPIQGIWRFLDRYRGGQIKPKLIGLPHQASLAEILALGFGRGALYLFPRAVRAALRTHIRAKLDSQHF